MTKTRSKAKDNALMIEEDFFLNLPTFKLKEKMNLAIS